MSGVGVSSGHGTLGELFEAWRRQHKKPVPGDVRRKNRAKKPVDPKVVAAQEMRDFLDFLDVDVGPSRNGSPLVWKDLQGSLVRRTSDKAYFLRCQGKELAKTLNYREVPTDINLRFKVLGIYSRGHYTHVTLRPDSRKTAAALRDPKGYCDYMRQRVRQELDREFGHAVSVLLVAECKHEDQDELTDPPHLQGVVGVPYAEKDRLKRALRTAGGPYANKWFGDNKAVWLEEPYNLFNWMNYNAKDLELTRNRIGGNPIICSQAVTQDAKAIYAKTCAIILDARDAPPPS